eukprot:910157_1
MGTLGCDDSKLQEEWGVIPSAIHDIFDTLSRRTNNDYKVQCSFIEIYNEEIKDLLDPHTSKQMDIWEVKGATRVQNMRFESVQSINQCANVLRRGGRARSTGSTRMNAKSSRSHAIFTVHLEKTVTEPMVIQSKFHFVDLAGSERVAKTGSSGTRFAEGVSINAGLLALGKVIAALSDTRSKTKHVPFRDSKVTRLLQDSLGGNSRTLMIACISPARSNMTETKSTLNWAYRTGQVMTKATVNKAVIRDVRSKATHHVTSNSNTHVTQSNQTTNRYKSDYKPMEYEILRKEYEILYDQKEHYRQKFDSLKEHYRQKIRDYEIQLRNQKAVIDSLKVQLQQSRQGFHGAVGHNNVNSSFSTAIWTPNTIKDKNYGNQIRPKFKSYIHDIVNDYPAAKSGDIRNTITKKLKGQIPVDVKDEVHAIIYNCITKYRTKLKKAKNKGNASDK